MTKTAIQYDVIVVGGGPAGIMAAGRAAERGKNVLLLEKNKKLGEKLKISGGGRCNITNAEEDTRVFLKHYGDAEQFLYSIFAQFSNKDTFTFFEQRGLPLVVQARKRAFPHTEKSIDVFNTLEQYMKEGGVTVKTSSPADRIIASDGTIQGVVSEKDTYTAKNYILATGGVSHSETGSTGDGFNWLKELGHSVAAPSPSIVPLAVRESWVKSLSGTSLSFMKISFYVEGKKKFSKTGKVLFTHFGLSGPLILNSAVQVGDLLQEGKVTATIDAYPDTDHGALEQKILSTFENHKNKLLKNIMDEIVPHGMIDAIFSLVPSIDPETKVHSITKDQRKLLINTLKALPMTITGLMGFDRAVVADGGIPLTEMDMKTMRSKLFTNLYITGDLLHIRRPSGGFSLQLCWTTGWVAGGNA
ncbi:MAG: NAD(FAD)-utilizing dehydrogenase [Candidatus Nomurabacteria bacterium]|nr:NAD(FAD)-utilizing dehydrogenase [Candidatus Nomurabacteria bacterium]